MPEDLCQLECLPNEILFDIIKYFDTYDLYQAFYNLNCRFDMLLHSLKNLSLTLRKSCPYENSNYQIFASYIYTLKLDNTADINLNDFPNVRRLELLSPSCEQLKQLQSDIYQYLEYLSIDHRSTRSSNDLPNLRKKIFSNGFPCLKFCNLFEPKPIYLFPSSIQLSQLRRLTVTYINFSTYQTILSTCPNLYFLQFTIYFLWKEAFFLKPHSHLQRMIIKFELATSPMSDCNINDYLACVPALKQLIIYRMEYADLIHDYVNYNWLALFIDQYLPLLDELKFYLSIASAEGTSAQANTDLVDRLMKNFKQLHQNRYRSELNVDLTTSVYYNNN